MKWQIRQTDGQHRDLRVLHNSSETDSRQYDAAKAGQWKQHARHDAKIPEKHETGDTQRQP